MVGLRFVLNIWCKGLGCAGCCCGCSPLCRVSWFVDGVCAGFTVTQFNIIETFVKSCRLGLSFTLNLIQGTAWI